MAKCLVLALLLALGGWLVAGRLSLSYDLGYFLPQPVTEAQQVLIDRVGQGPGSQLMYLTLPGTGTAEREALAGRLRGLDVIARVLPEAFSDAIGALPPAVFRHRYLLADVDTSSDGLSRALEARRRDLSLMDDAHFLALVAADPHLASVRVLEGFSPGAGQRRFRLDEGTPFLMLQTRAPAFDLGAQAEVVAAIKRAVTGAGGVTEGWELWGAGVYGLQLQTRVRAESTWFSLAAAGALTLLLWIAYRGAAAVLLASLPLAAGVVGGLAVLALTFPKVHGITLAFGFTLMGVTVDYGLHVLSHYRGGRRGSAAVWPTLALSAASSALAFLAFTLSGSRGLVQLGIFAASGIVAAALSARFLPSLTSALPRPAQAPEREHARQRVRLRLAPMLISLTAGAALLALAPPWWNDDLSALTPVPAQTLAVDGDLRARSGAPDIRYLLASRSNKQADVLAQVETTTRLLEQARLDSVIADYSAVTTLVPEPRTQSQRRRDLAAEGIADRVATAAANTGFRPGAFQPFVEDVRRAAGSRDTVTAETYAGGALGPAVSTMLYPDDDEWVALTFLVGVAAPEVLAERLAAAGTGTRLVDLRDASRSLLATYRDRLLLILTGALAAVALVLAMALKAWRRLLWVLGTVLGGVALATGVTVHLLGSLSLFELVASTLVAGLGLDYALFFSRPESSPGAERDTRHALTVCFASTLTVFALLACSGIPVLHGIGMTVAVGVCVAFALARAGRYVSPES